MAEKKDKRPNFLIIVADDLGYTDISPYGSEIPTPNIASLARELGSLRFTSFHVASACSPTRAMLLTGMDHHLTGLGQLSEMIRNSPAHQGRPGHEGYLNEKVVTVTELLRDGGYWTALSGKWHLGLKPEYGPKRRGFERSFALLPGCANHFGFEPGYEDSKEPPRFFETAVAALHAEDGKYVPSSELPEDFYSSIFYAEKLVEYFQGRSEEEREKPFFAYLPFSAPHWPLQAPRKNFEKFKGRYDDGPEALRLRRLQRLKELGLVGENVVPHDFVSVGKEPKEWSSLSGDERTKSARAMEVYAGMVDCMDENIGKVLDYLKQSGEYDNTYIFFMSDNGAEGASYEARDMIREDILTHIAKYYDNSLQNIGEYNSFVWYGNRWAQAATAPSRLYKMHSTEGEGGCRVPLILKPATTQHQQQQFSNDDNTTNTTNSILTTDAFCTVMDIPATLLSLADLTHPYPSPYKTRPILPMTGKSWTDFLSNLNTTDLSSPFLIHGPTQATGFECAGSGALRRGKYKITYVAAPHGPQKWELFDILADPGETEDISEQFPEEFEEMLKLWEEYKEEVGVVGVRHEYANGTDGDDGNRDEFEDTGKWIRWIGRDSVPDDVQERKFW